MPQTVKNGPLIRIRHGFAFSSLKYKINFETIDTVHATEFIILILYTVLVYTDGIYQINAVHLLLDPHHLSIKTVYKQTIYFVCISKAMLFFHCWLDDPA